MVNLTIKLVSIFFILSHNLFLVWICKMVFSDGIEFSFSNLWDYPEFWILQFYLISAFLIFVEFIRFGEQALEEPQKFAFLFFLPIIASICMMILLDG